MLHAVGVLILVFIGVLAASVVWHGVGPLHWGRFFFRGWVVLSLIWVATIGAVGWEGIVAPLPPPPIDDTLCLGLTSSDCKMKILDLAIKGLPIGPESTPAPLSLMIERAGHVAAVALLPPAGLLVLGFACAWVLHGLRGGKPA
jgi:hypothetical protein